MYTIKNAKFIRQGVDFGDIRPVFKKCFTLEKPIKKATLYCSALGFYEAFINNTRVGEFIFAPGWTCYGKRIQFQKYDVTDLLEQNNSVDIMLGNGRRYHGNPHENYNSITDREDALIAALNIQYEDGTVDFYPTDETWECSKTNILYSNVYNGEFVDFNAKTDEQFPVKVLDDIPTDLLVEQEGEEVREFDKITAKTVIKTPKGETVIDFGQNLTGYVEWAVPERKGAEFKIYHAEVLDRECNFYIDNMRSAKVEIKVISDGNSRIYKPHFSYQGFRYIKLEGFEEDEIKLERFNAIVVHSDMKRIGHFDCAHPLVKKLYQNIVWGQRGNFLDIPTDCNQRDERFGWTGDAQVFARTASMTYKTDKFFKKWMHDVALEQKENGAVTDIVPNIVNWGASGSSAWADVAVIVPYWIYRCYGNTQIIKDQFESMKKWILFMEANGTERGLFDNHNHHYGDWLSLDAGNEATGGFTDKNLIGSAYLVYSNKLFIEMGEAIGEDMTYFKQLYDVSLAAYRNKYINSEKLEHQTQTAHVLAIYFGLSDDIYREGQKLVDDIEQCGHLKTGFVGTPYLLHALTKIGRADVAYKLLLKQDFPSWLFPVTKGATTMWERWDGMKEDGSFATPAMNSFNHYAYGSVGDWLYTTVAGIDTDVSAPAYKHIIFKPITCKELGRAQAKILTDNGEVSASWEYTGKGDECRFTFVVPKGSTATLFLEGEQHQLNSGTYEKIIFCKGV